MIRFDWDAGRTCSLAEYVGIIAAVSAINHHAILLEFRGEECWRRIRVFEHRRMVWTTNGPNAIPSVPNAIFAATSSSALSTRAEFFYPRSHGLGDWRNDEVDPAPSSYA